MPQAQDFMVLIGELVKALNLYSNHGVGHHSNVNNNSNARVASKKFWMQNAQSNCVFLRWSLCLITLLFVTILLCCFFFSLLHCITFMHFILGFFKKNNYKTQTILLVRQCLKLIWFLTIRVKRTRFWEAEMSI